ncbi:hypothetical protein [Curtobacterium flaccumfaciens]|uniref:hypothetical protein n=1 Tax=Curtobacterium flaccumfaciens TaxID=2035 RepID=UPI001ADB3CB9|nr:hypothetical protein [Curtobacterium flaccumfaciens]MBO9040638.1 hypothetical protein [Curtobacterium flaccumfaciens pv. flaccumfaciens]
MVHPAPRSIDLHEEPDEECDQDPDRRNDETEDEPVPPQVRPLGRGRDGIGVGG